MVKRVISIPLFILYFLAVSGLIVNLHYCGGKLYSYNTESDKNCCCEKNAAEEPSGSTSGIKKSDNCCSNTTISFKLNQDKHLAFSDFVKGLHAISDVPSTGLIIFNFPAIELLPALAVPATVRNNGPPGRWQHIPLYQLYSSRVFYS